MALTELTALTKASPLRHPRGGEDPGQTTYSAGMSILLDNEDIALLRNESFAGSTHARG